MQGSSEDKRRAWRVVLVDDHPLVREAYRSLIDRQPDMTVLQCLSGSEALTSILRTMAVDVVLLDYRLDPRAIDGVPLIQRLRARFPTTRLLVCSATDDPGTMAAVMLAGAQGFLSKSGELDECVKAVRAVAGGMRYINGAVSPRRSAVDVMVSASCTGEFVMPHDLTIKEFDVLRCTKQGLTPTMISEKFRRSVKTISGHKVSALRKQGMLSDTEIFVQQPLSRDR